MGELALTGALRGVPGAISSATEAIRAGRNIIVATENAAEVGLISKEGCFIADHLQTVCAFLEGKHALERPLAQDMASPTATADLRDVIGQEQGKRGLEITAAGGHNLLLIGPPGTGKTMLASRLSGILPPLSNEEALESAAILSLVNADTVQNDGSNVPFAHLIIAPRLLLWSAAAQYPPRERYRWRTTEFCSLMNCLNLSDAHWMRYVNL